MNDVPTAYLQQLKDRGILDTMYKMGLISYKAYMMLEVRKKVDGLMRMGRSRGEAARAVAESMRVHRSTIYRYLPPTTPTPSNLP